MYWISDVLKVIYFMCMKDSDKDEDIKWEWFEKNLFMNRKFIKYCVLLLIEKFILGF